MPVIELSITDDFQLGSLESLLRREIPEVIVGRRPGPPEPGALGWEDVLTLTFAGISALADTIELLRSYLAARDEETGITITATNISKRRTRELTVRNATEAQVREFTAWLTDD